MLVKSCYKAILVGQGCFAPNSLAMLEATMAGDFPELALGRPIIDG
jgi:hypothetical protein